MLGGGKYTFMNKQTNLSDSSVEVQDLSAVDYELWIVI